jgi:hypothetical protein
MAKITNTRYKMHLKSLGRLKLTLTVAMLGFFIDTVMTSWMLKSNNEYYESNTMLFPEIGIPLMVLNYVFADHWIPRTTLFDNIFYSLSILQWSGPLQNLLVLLGITSGISYFYTLPIILTVSFLILSFKLNKDDRIMNDIIKILNLK